MAAERPVTGTMLRDVVLCERRAWHDLHTDRRLSDEVGAFVRMLWAEGVRHEAEVLGHLEGRIADLREVDAGGRREATLAAIADARNDHVLGAEVAHARLLGRPDVLSRIDGRWVAGDAKSGTPFMPDGVRIREEYGIQVSHYAAILGAEGLGDGDRAFVIGPDGARVMLDLHAQWGATTMAAVVAARTRRAEAIIAGTARTRGAASAICGLCHWRTLCRGALEAADDLTLIAEVGRSMRRIVETVAPDRASLAALDVDSVVRPDGRPGLPGLGAARLARFRDRARLLVTPGAGPYAREPLGLSHAPVEWHLDIEADPSRGGLVYLHGIWERRLAPAGGSSERFIHFFAEGGATGEGDAFAAVWAFLQADSDAMVYHYSAFERTSYRELARRHPHVCSGEEMEAFFAGNRVVDLYADVVRPRTEWPLSSYGIKPIAKFCGFAWKAEDASGASSIAWYDEYRRAGDQTVRDRIIDYNASDCMASAVVLDALIALPVGLPPWPRAASPVAAIGEGGSEGGDEQHADPGAVAAAALDGGAGVTLVGRDADGDEEACAVWHAEGEELRRFFDAVSDRDEPTDRPVADVGPSASAAPARTFRPVSATVCSAPTLQPCVAIGAEAGDRDMPALGLERDYGRLATPLPLLGGGAMRTGPGGATALYAALRAEMPWLEVAIGAVERQFRVATWAGRPWLQFRPLLLVGGPGVGKSHFARRLAAIAGVPAATLDLGAMHDAAALVSVSRGWSNAKPCWPAQMMAAHRCANPVLMLDELEKAGGSSQNGRPHQALLAMTEPATSAAFMDTCLMAEVDMSAVCWIATANDLEAVPAPLASRFDVVRVDAPGAEHFDLVLDGLVSAQELRWALPPGMMPPLPPRARATLREAFVRTRSVRGLRRHVGMVLAALVAGADRPVH